MSTPTEVPSDPMAVDTPAVPVPAVNPVKADDPIFDIVPIDSTVPVQVAKSVISECVTIKNMINDLVDQGEGTASRRIEIPNVTWRALNKVVEFATHAVANPTKELSETERQKLKKTQEAKGELLNLTPEWDREFAAGLGQEVLFELIMASNFLDYKRLLDACCRQVAEMLKGKTPEQIRKEFNIKNDFTPEEEEEIFRENGWRD